MARPRWRHAAGKRDRRVIEEVTRVWRKNVGPLDRAIRLTGGMLIVVLGVVPLSGLQGRLVGLLVAVFGVWFIVTGTIGRCPLYVLLGISTLREEQTAEGTIRSDDSMSTRGGGRPQAA